jgi:hypothetical protein
MTKTPMPAREDVVIELITSSSGVDDVSILSCCAWQIHVHTRQIELFTNLIWSLSAFLPSFSDIVSCSARSLVRLG